MNEIRACTPCSQPCDTIALQMRNLTNIRGQRRHTITRRHTLMPNASLVQGRESSNAQKARQGACLERLVSNQRPRNFLSRKHLKHHLCLLQQLSPLSAFSWQCSPTPSTSTIKDPPKNRRAQLLHHQDMHSAVCRTNALPPRQSQAPQPLNFGFARHFKPPSNQNNMLCFPRLLVPA